MARVKFIIEEIRGKLIHLDTPLVQELETAQKRRAAGWLIEEIESKLTQIEELCQKN